MLSANEQLSGNNPLWYLQIQVVPESVIEAYKNSYWLSSPAPQNVGFHAAQGFNSAGIFFF